MKSRRVYFVMGTFLSVLIEGADAPDVEHAHDLILSEVSRLENLLSIYRDDSEVSTINRSAGVASVRVSPDTYEAISKSLRFSEITDGAFDPTVYPMTRRDAAADRGLRPFSDLIGYRLVTLNPNDSSVFLARPGMGLDLGGIGKGLALDVAFEKVRQDCRVDEIGMDFGGQLMFWRRDGFNEPLRIAIESPMTKGKAVCQFTVQSSCSVSTSSNAERTGNGAHLVNPRTACAESWPGSVTVIAETGMIAEILSTAMFIAGPVHGKQLLRRFNGARAIVCLGSEAVAEG